MEHREAERICVRRFGLNASITGIVNTGVVLFNSVFAPVVEGSWGLDTFCTILDDANLGTTFKFIKAGRWQVNCNLTLDATELATQQVDCGITRDSSAAFLNNTVQVSSSTLFDFASATTPAGAGVIPMSIPIKLSAEIPITDTMAGSSTLGIVRVHAADSNTGGIPTGIRANNGVVYFRWLGDLRG